MDVDGPTLLHPCPMAKATGEPAVARASGGQHTADLPGMKGHFGMHGPEVNLRMRQKHWKAHSEADGKF